MEMFLSIETKLAALEELEKDPYGYHSDEIRWIRLNLDVERAEQDFREMQDRYDSFVERHYEDRYERWYEQVAERYQRRIRRLFFRLRGLEKQKREFFDDPALIPWCPFEDFYFDWEFVDQWI